MATALAQRLTTDHRRRQLALRAVTLRQLVAMWPSWDGGRASFRSFAAGLLPLVQARHGDASALAVDYYRAFRVAEGARGAPEPRLARFDADKVVTSLFVTGPVQVARSLRAGQTAAAAKATALTTVSGAVSRHVLDGARHTLIRTVGADPQAKGWRRVIGGKGCDFCQMLAGRGAVYSADTADFQSHDHCACAAEPVF